VGRGDRTPFQVDEGRRETCGFRPTFLQRVKKTLDGGPVYAGGLGGGGVGGGGGGGVGGWWGFWKKKKKKKTKTKQKHTHKKKRISSKDQNS